MLGRERRGRKTRNMLQIFWKDLASTVKVTTLLASCEYTQLAMNRSFFFFGLFASFLGIGLAELLLLMSYSLFFHPLLSFPSSFFLVSPCLSIVSFFFPPSFFFPTPHPPPPPVLLLSFFPLSSLYFPSSSLPPPSFHPSPIPPSLSPILPQFLM